MAIDDDEDDVNESVNKKKGSMSLKLILIVFAVVLLVGGSIGGTLYMTGAFDGTKMSAEKDSGTDAKEKPAGKEALYFAFDPPFVVNFTDGKQIRYLQVSIEAMSHDPMAIENLKKHMPVVRNNLIFMFSNLNYETLNSVAGKKKLQQEALTEIQNIMKEKTGSTGIEAVYFTGFVMQ